MSEQRRPVPFYVGESGSEVFGWLHESAATSGCAVVCPPVGYDSVPAHRTLRHLAETLASRGVETVRLDYHGTGDSNGGDDLPNRVPVWVKNIVSVIGLLRRRRPGLPVFVVGLRAGALLGWLAAREEAVEGVVLWAPPRSGKLLVRELQALAMSFDQPGGEVATPPAEDGGLDAAGFRFDGETLAALREIQLDPGMWPDAPALIVTRDDLPDDAKLLDIVAAVNTECTHVRGAGYGAMMAEAHYTQVPRQTISAITDWIGARCGACAGAADRVSAPGPLTIRPDTGGAACEEGVVLLGRGGGQVGVITEPTGPSNHLPWIVMLNPGSVHRIGSNRMYVQLARRLAGRGFACLRLDVGGIGDSAVVDGWRENDPYPPHANQNIADAVAAIAERGRGRKVVLLGLCSGAFHAFFSGQRVDGVVQSIMINPLTYSWKDGMPLDTPDVKHYWAMRNLEKSVRDPGKWKKVFRGQVNVAKVGKAVLGKAGRVVRGRVAGWLDIFAPNRGGDRNVRRSLRNLASRNVHASFVFSPGDPGQGMLLTEAGALVRRLAAKGAVSIDTIDGSDHTFTQSTARARLLDLIVDRLTARFPPTGS